MGNLITDKLYIHPEGKKNNPLKSRNRLVMEIVHVVIGSSAERIWSW